MLDINWEDAVGKIMESADSDDLVTYFRRQGEGIAVMYMQMRASGLKKNEAMEFTVEYIHSMLFVQHHSDDD